MCTRELPCRNSLRKEDVQLFVSSSLHLWKAEVRPRENGQSCACPEEACLTVRIPCWLLLAYKRSIMGLGHTSRVHEVAL